MGIVYCCSIRCFEVKNTYAVDLKVFECNGDRWEARLALYKRISKQNIKKVLAVYLHEPDFRWKYTIDRILIPPRTNVIAFGNDACDSYDMTNYYYVEFFNKEGQLIDERTVTSHDEHNHFMVLVPQGTHYISYSINQEKSDSDFDERYHDFNFSTFCIGCNASVEEIRRYHSTYWLTEFNPICCSKAFKPVEWPIEYQLSDFDPKCHSYVFQTPQ